MQDTDGITVAGSSNVTIQTTDQRLADAAEAIALDSLRAAGGALEGSNDLARDVVDQASVILDSGLKFGERVTGDALAEGFDLSRDAIGFGERLTGKLGDFTTGLFGDAIDAVTGVVKESQAQIGNTVTNLNNIARQQSTTTDERVQGIAEKALIAAGVMVALLVAGMVYTRASA